MKTLALLLNISLFITSVPTLGQQQQMSEEQKQEFIHKGLSQAEMQKACEDMGEHCNQGASTSTGWVEDGTNIAYQLAFTYLVGAKAMKFVLGGFKVKDFWNDIKGPKNSSKGGSTGSSSGGDTGGDSGGSDSGGSEEKGTSLKQMCNIAATAGVAAVWGLQMLNQKKVKEKFKASNQESTQAEGLYSIANIHQSKKANAQTLSALFGVLAACYTVAAFEKGYTPPDVESLIRAGLSGLLATGYGIAAGKHNQIKKKALRYAEALPNKGECTPGSACFCARNDESSKAFHSNEYKLYCDYVAGPTNLCIGPDGSLDQQCLCRQKGNCLTSKLARAAGNSGLSPNGAKKVQGIFQSLEDGSFLKNKDKNLKYADNLVARAKANIPSAGKLTSNQKKTAAFMAKNGVSPQLAALAAQVKVSEKDKKEMAEFNPFSLGTFKDNKKPLTAGKAADPSSNDDLSDIFGDDEATTQHLSKVSAYSNNDSIITAQNLAVQNAEINMDDTEPIFDIISSRYLQSDIWIKAGQ